MSCSFALISNFILKLFEFWLFKLQLTTLLFKRCGTTLVIPTFWVGPNQHLSVFSPFPNGLTTLRFTLTYGCSAVVTPLWHQQLTGKSFTNVWFDLYCIFILKSGLSPDYHPLYPHHSASELGNAFPRATCLYTFQWIATFRSQHQVPFVSVLDFIPLLDYPSFGEPNRFWKRTFLFMFSSGGWIRTTDLEVMGLTSWPLLHPAMLAATDGFEPSTYRLHGVIPIRPLLYHWATSPFV